MAVGQVANQRSDYTPEKGKASAWALAGFKSTGVKTYADGSMSVKPVVSYCWQQHVMLVIRGRVAPARRPKHCRGRLK
jgi:hypothetical protein